MNTEAHLIKKFFKRSKKQKGKLYVCKKEYLPIPLNRFKESDYYFKDGRKHLTKEALELAKKEFKTVRQWKYGKTKNIEKRMEMYSRAYDLLETFDVNHLSLREKLIHYDWYIQDDKRFKDARDEHVDFNPIERVKLYATCDIELYRDERNYLRIRLSDEDGEFCTRGVSELLECFHL